MTMFEEYPDRLHCSHPKGEPARIIKANGDVLFFMRCVDCDRPTHPGHWLPHDTIFNNPEDVPIYQDYRESNPPCERCGEPSTELHHWYPQAIDGAAEADRWPTSHLCRLCHGQWHLSILRAALGGTLGNAPVDASPE